MKIVHCQCGRTIGVQGGIVGLRMRFPQPIYLCPCGCAYIPEDLGCLVFDEDWQEDNATPEVLSPSEYEKWKKEELKVAKKIEIRS